MFILSQRNYDRAVDDDNEAIRVDPTVAAAASGRAHALRFVAHMTGPVADDRKALTLALDERSWSQIGKALKQLGAAPRRTWQTFQSGGS
jgi:hypothetical protein